MMDNNFGMLYSVGVDICQVAIGEYYDRNIGYVHDCIIRIIITNEGLITTGKYDVVGVDII